MLEVVDSVKQIMDNHFMDETYSSCVSRVYASKKIGYICVQDANENCRQNDENRNTCPRRVEEFFVCG